MSHAGDLHRAFTYAQDYLSKPGTLGNQVGQEFICHAIEDVARHDLVTWETARDARRIVMDRLGGANQVESWLRLGGYLPYNLTMDQTFDLCQEYRMRWLRELVGEFYKKAWAQIS